jgi:hypothetical protein
MDALPTATDLLAFLGWEPDAQITVQAEAHLKAVTAQVRGYTRGVGFGEAGSGFADEDVCAVVVSAAARSLSNPTQDRRAEAGSFNSAPGSLASFSLLETLVLDGYRRRAA